MKNLKWYSITKAFKDSVLMDALVTLENSFELSVLFKRIGWRVISACFSRKGKLPSRIRFLKSFLQHLLKLKRVYGSIYVVRYLKACQLAVQKVIAGTPVSSLKEVGGDLPFPRLDRSGLPRVIPVYDRRLIKGGSTSIVRYWLTLFSLYRIIKVPGQLKLSTITEPTSASETDIEEVGTKLKAIAKRFARYVPKINGSEVDVALLEAASSTSVASWTGLFKDRALLARNGLDTTVEKLIVSLNLSRLGVLWDLMGHLVTLRQDLDYSLLHKVVGMSNVGQLSIKEEAAGKVRVFALVDIWTQSILKPIHDSLFTFLKSLPNDATFDQRAAVKRCLSKVKISKKSFGYDLSAATDRLPISIQVDVLSSFFGKEVAEAWKELLIQRDYILTNKKYGDANVRYSVGQPMGALSSWAMLDVTHHLIVQLAAIEAGKIPKESNGWYENYEVLGDDIQLFDELVATHYLDIMSKLGVEINLSKSVVANREVFEFAKVTAMNGKDVSALSWKAFVSQNTWMGRTNIIFSLLERPLGLTNWVRWVQSITKHNKRGIDNMTILALWTMFSNSGRVPLTVVLSSLMSTKKAVRRTYRDILLNANIAYAISCISAILAGNPIPMKNLDNFKWRVEESWIKVMLSKPVLVWKNEVNLAEEGPKLAEKMVRLLVPGCPETSSIFSFNYDPLWTDYDQTLNAIYLYFCSLISKKISKLEGRPLGTKIVDLSIEEISEEISSMDRIKELLNIVARAEAKVARTEEKPKRVGTPLKIIKTYLQGSKIRPKWTLNATADLRYWRKFRDAGVV